METVLFSLCEPAARLEVLLAECLEAPMPQDKAHRDFIHNVVMKVLGMILGAATQSEYDQQHYLQTHQLLKNQIMEYTQCTSVNADNIFLCLESALLGEIQTLMPFFDEVPVIVTRWSVYESYDAIIQYYINL